MKIFISQPMTGFTKEEVSAAYKCAVKEIKERWGEKVEILHSYNENCDSDRASQINCLADSIKILAKADRVLFVPGWRNSNGCNIEFAICTLYRIPFIDMEMRRLD